MTIGVINHALSAEILSLRYAVPPPSANIPESGGTDSIIRRLPSCFFLCFFVVFSSDNLRVARLTTAPEISQRTGTIFSGF